MPSGAEQAAQAARKAKGLAEPKAKSGSISKLGGLLSIISIVSALRKGDFAMEKYSKFIGSIVGSLIGVVVLWLANKGLATCTTTGAAETCTVLGISTAQINVAVVSIVSALMVWAFPKNA